MPPEEAGTVTMEVHVDGERVGETVLPDGEVVESPPPEPKPGQKAGMPYFEKRLLELRGRVRVKEARRDLAKSELKIANSELEAAIADLLAHVDELNQPSLFQDGVAEQPSGENAEGDDWKAVPLHKAIGGRVTPGVLRALVEAEITTVGQLAAFTEGGGRLVDIKGIGESKAESVEQAMEAFWAEAKEEFWAERKLAAEQPSGENGDSTLNSDPE